MWTNFKPSTPSMRSIVRNPDPWEWFSEYLEARRGILSRPEKVGRNQRCDRLHSFRYEGRSAGTRGNRCHSLIGTGDEGSRGT
jgi:hypothetical protein